ncbi:TIGR01906 family membrane protein [Lachnospiraceae bacterium 46-61]
MKVIHILASIFCVIALIAVILISSVDIAIYGNIGYFQKEYQKYNVLKNINMNEKDLLYVTEEMMSYLKGNRNDLHIKTTIDNKQQEFFNQKEIAHMEDVKVLFLNGILIRKIGVVICIAAIIFLTFQNKKRFLLLSLKKGMISFIVMIGILSAIISTNFTKYFIIFHKIFFSNNLWILNPDTDRLINIVPEPFFIDTAIRIAAIFGGMIVCVYIICSILLKLEIKKTGV